MCFKFGVRSSPLCSAVSPLQRSTLGERRGRRPEEHPPSAEVKRRNEEAKLPHQGSGILTVIAAAGEVGSGTVLAFHNKIQSY